MTTAAGTRVGRRDRRHGPRTPTATARHRRLTRVSGLAHRSGWRWHTYAYRGTAEHPQPPRTVCRLAAEIRHHLRRTNASPARCPGCGSSTRCGRKACPQRHGTMHANVLRV